MLSELADIHANLCGLPGLADLQVLAARLQQWGLQYNTSLSMLDGGSHLTCVTLLKQIHVLSTVAVKSQAIAATFHSNIRTALINRTTLGKGQSFDRCEDDPYLPWLTWFDAHIAYPYPSRDECNHLVSLIPGQTAAKLRTWLTNRRRRSGWTELYEKHAHKDRTQMAQLFEQYDDALLRNMLAQNTRKAIERVKSITRSEKRRQVGDWVDQVLNQRSTATPTTPPPSLTHSSSPSSSPSASSSSTPSTPLQKQSVRAHPYDRTKAQMPKSKRGSGRSPAASSKKPSLYAEPRLVSGKSVGKVEPEVDTSIPVAQDFSLDIFNAVHRVDSGFAEWQMQM